MLIHMSPCCDTIMSARPTCGARCATTPLTSHSPPWTEVKVLVSLSLAVSALVLYLWVDRVLAVSVGFLL